MIEKVRRALRLKTEAYDEELRGLIDAARADLELAGIKNAENSDPLIDRAVITFCRVNFGSPEDYARLKASYDEQKAQLQMATGYGLE